MNLQHLPPEILAQILGRVFPRDWYRSPERHECMKLRLVSRKLTAFDDAKSYDDDTAPVLGKNMEHQLIAFRNL